MGPLSAAEARVAFRMGTARAALTSAARIKRRDRGEATSVMEGARAAPDEDLQALDRFRSFREKSQRGGFLAYNREFHCALARLSGNERMTTAACELIDQMHRLIRVSVDNVERREPNRLVLEHVRIIEALQRRDGRRAAALLRRHIDAAERRVARALERAAVVA